MQMTLGCWKITQYTSTRMRLVGYNSILSLLSGMCVMTSFQLSLCFFLRFMFCSWNAVSYKHCCITFCNMIWQFETRDRGQWKWILTDTRGPMCSHCATLQRPDNKIVFWRSRFYIWWAIAVIPHCGCSFSMSPSPFAVYCTYKNQTQPVCQRLLVSSVMMFFCLLLLTHLIHHTSSNDEVWDITFTITY